MFVKFPSFQLRHNKIMCTVSNINIRITTTRFYKIILHYTWHDNKVRELILAGLFIMNLYQLDKQSTKFII